MMVRCLDDCWLELLLEAEARDEAGLSGSRDKAVRFLQYEVREGREAVMPQSGLEINLAECEDICSLQLGED